MIQSWIKIKLAVTRLRLGNGLVIGAAVKLSGPVYHQNVHWEGLRTCLFRFQSGHEVLTRLTCGFSLPQSW